MARVSYKYGLSQEDKALAEKNGIPLSTVYARLRSGWDKRRAITSPSTRKARRPIKRNELGEIVTDDPKGKMRMFQVPQRYEEQLEQAIEVSGKSQSEWVADVIMDYLSRKNSQLPAATRQGN